jgi:hypothetical protein
MRGTPHVHSLIWIANDGITEDTVSSEDSQEQQKIKNLVKKTVSAILVDNDQYVDNGSGIPENYEKELEYNWNPQKDYFTDKCHPCRGPFNNTWHYERTTTGDFIDKNVQNQYRRLQIANQFHDCCGTCFKYCYGQEKVCRFGFPKPRDETLLEPCIRKGRDKKSRIRIDVLPQRNNANLNGSAFDPLLVIAHGGNHDLQYIGNSIGAAEYVASYAAKSEEPDKKLTANLYAKKLSSIEKNSTYVTDREKLNAICNALLGSSQVGAVQACYFLLGLQFVKSSRQVVNLNPLHRKYKIKIVFAIKCSSKTPLVEKMLIINYKYCCYAYCDR